MSGKSPASAKPAPGEASTSNFIRQVVEADLSSGRYEGRTWAGKPGPAAAHAAGALDPAKIRTRFPPEPNGYLHFGHAKSILLNFGLAKEYGGVCHLRFDDTNPTKEEQEYVDSIVASVKWLGCDWGDHLYYASDNFELLYAFAEELVRRGHAYVDSQSADEMRANRGTLTQGGRASKYRSRTPAENLALLREMKAGKHADGSHVLRAKIDMESPNINLRDPAMYRIRHAHHHRTGDAWCLYPTYDWAHGVTDAIENITHSLCTLEFQDHRPLYDWFNERLAAAELLQQPLPQQIEFARLNLTFVVLSKRKLLQLVEEKHVTGWDDPRMPTLVGAQRRGYTPEGFRSFAERIGVAKADSWIDFSVLEDCMREHLNEVAPRRMAVLDPVKLVIENWPAGKVEMVEVPNHPQKPEWGKRSVPFSGELWIEREDYAEVPPKGYFRLYPGNRVRLRYGYVVECIGMDPIAGTIRARYFEDSKSGSLGADAYKVKGNIHWISCAHAVSAEIRVYDRLFRVPNPGAGKRDFLMDLNHSSLESLAAYVEATLEHVEVGEQFQFERYGYFIVDTESQPASSLVFNRTVTLRDSWSDPRTRSDPGARMPRLTDPEDELDIEPEEPEAEPYVDYEISVTTPQYPLNVIESMWKREEISIPDFQREYVWSIKQASLLIESFLLGLPVPQVFFYQDSEFRNLVIDGQQRIRSVLYYLEGYFGDESTQSKRQVFRLTGLDPRSPYANKKFVELDETSKRRLLAATLSAVVVKQLNPSDERSSIYHIFERLNTGGTALRPQEIRNCVYRGGLIPILRKMNLDSNWRRILGKKTLDKHQKDVELVLRIFALSKFGSPYEKPMKAHLNRAMLSERSGDSLAVSKFSNVFPQACELVATKLGEKPFHVRGPLNSSVLDSVMCAIIDNLDNLPANLGERWKALLHDKLFEESTQYSTSDGVVLRERFALARKYLTDSK